MSAREIQISVPWGHIAAKEWGQLENPTVLVFHGILDNAGAFDRLIPLLPQKFHYVCFDLPGHGRSSHLPPHVPLHTLDNLIAYRRAIQHFKKDKYIIMGHSYGGQIGFLYAQLFPNEIEKLILLETIHLFPVSSKQFKDYMIHSFIEFLDRDNKLRNGTPPMYTYEEVLEKVRDQRRHGVIPTEAAECLMQRILVPAGDGKYTLSTDQRLKNFVNPIHDFRYILETMKKFPLKCPVLMILANDSNMQKIIMEPIIKVLKKQRSVAIKYVEGDHDVHNANPEIVAPLVSAFLNKSKL